MSAMSASLSLLQGDFSKDASMCSAVEPFRLAMHRSAPASLNAEYTAGSLRPREAYMVTSPCPSGKRVPKSNPDSARREAKPDPSEDVKPRDTMSAAMAASSSSSRSNPESSSRAASVAGPVLPWKKSISMRLLFSSSIVPSPYQNP